MRRITGMYRPPPKSDDPCRPVGDVIPIDHWRIDPYKLAEALLRAEPALRPPRAPVVLASPRKRTG